MKLHHLYETFDEVPEEDMDTLTPLQRYSYWHRRVIQSCETIEHLCDRIYASPAYKSGDIVAGNGWQQDPARYGYHGEKMTAPIVGSNNMPLYAVKTNSKAVSMLDHLKRVDAECDKATKIRDSSTEQMSTDELDQLRYTQDRS